MGVTTNKQFGATSKQSEEISESANVLKNAKVKFFEREESEQRHDLGEGGGIENRRCKEGKLRKTWVNSFRTLGEIAF